MELYVAVCVNTGTVILWHDRILDRVAVVGGVLGG